MALSIYKYDTLKVYDYAKKYSLNYNTQFFNFDSIGGDCTNFVSQCIFAGTDCMNFSNNGWFYVNSFKRSPSWTGVNELYNFLINNKLVGPFAEISNLQNASVGDVIQLGNPTRFYHSLIITKKENEQIFVSAHSYNAFNKPLSEYNYFTYRVIKILGYRK